MFMINKVFKLAFFTLIVCMVLAFQVMAQEAKNPTLEQQLQSIIEGQKRIERRLSAIEATQRGLVAASGRRAAGGSRGCGTRGGGPVIGPNKVYEIPIDHSPIQGNKNAKITIVEVSEVECPYSSRFHPIIKEVLRAYPKDVKHMFKHLPLGFHTQAKPGAKAILAAGEQGKYFEMLDIFFEKGSLKRVRGEKPEDLQKRLEDFYKTLAKEIGLNVKKFMKDYKNKDAKWEEIINKDIALAKNINVRGTPTFFLNGKNTKARSLQAFKEEIDKILKEEKEQKDKKGKKKKK